MMKEPEPIPPLMQVSHDGEMKMVECEGCKDDRKALEALWGTTHYISNQAMQYDETANNLQHQADNCDNHLNLYWECDTLDEFIAKIKEKEDGKPETI